VVSITTELVTTPPDSEITAFARTLRADLAAIESELALADDPDGEIARARMELVYGSAAADLFFGLLGDSPVSEVPYSHPAAVLEPPILAAAPERITYDDFRKRLSFTGVLTTEIRDALTSVPGVPALFPAAVDSLYAENQKVVGPFFDRYPELRPLYDAYVASADSPEEKRSQLLASILPELKRRRRRQLALQAISAAAGSDLRFATALLDDAVVLHAAGDSERPALDDVTALGTPGLSAQLFFADTVTGSADETRTAEADLAYSPGTDNQLPDNGGSPISGIWSGFLEAPENGFYNFSIEADAGATVTLSLGGREIALAQDGTVWRNDEPIELYAGTLQAVSCQVEKVTGTLAVRWQTSGRGWEVIPGRHLYSALLTGHLHQLYVRFLKAVALAAASDLTATETAYLATRADLSIDARGWLNRLPVTGSPDLMTSTALLRALATLLDFATIKSELADGDERLLAVVKDPAAATQSPDSLLFSLSRWQPASLAALLARFGKDTADLADLETLRRVCDAHTWIKKAGVPAPVLIATATAPPPLSWAISRSSRRSPSWSRAVSTSPTASPTWWRAPPAPTASTSIAGTSTATGRHGSKSSSTSRTTRSYLMSGRVACSCSGSRF
jgi:hypothetical protein